MASYSDLLKDPRWQKRRLEVLEKASFTCQDCGAKDKELHVHHLVYRKGCKPWEYGLDELVCLCKPCHEVTGQTTEKLLRLCKTQKLKSVLCYLAETSTVSNLIAFASGDLAAECHERASKEAADGMAGWAMGRAWLANIEAWEHQPLPTPEAKRGFLLALGDVEIAAYKLASSPHPVTVHELVEAGCFSKFQEGDLT